MANSQLLSAFALMEVQTLHDADSPTSKGCDDLFFGNEVQDGSGLRYPD